MQKIKLTLVEITLPLFCVLIGFFIFTYKLADIPSGFYIDESLPGYNAYSLLQTGKDEYGKEWPIALRFYGSYNPPLYTFSVIPAISFFGLNVFATRFPATVFGTLSILVFYLFAKNSLLIKNKLSLFLGTLFFAITPWLVLYSRVGYEVGLAYLLFSTGVFLCFLGIKRSIYIIPGFLLLSLSTYTAYTQRFLVPLFIVAYIIIYRKDLNVKFLYAAITLSLISQIPNFYLLSTPAFFPKSDLFYKEVLSTQANKLPNFLPYPVSYFLAFAREFFSKYLVYFSPASLFFLPDPDLQRSIPKLSVFYPWMIIPFFAGLYRLYKEKTSNFVKFIILLLLICPIPAAITKDPFATHRALPLLLPLSLILLLGIDKIVSNMRHFFTVIISISLFLLSLTLLWRSYFVLLPVERATVWGYGFKQLAQKIKEYPDKHFLIDQSRIKPAYVQLAFFLSYPPEKFQKETQDNAIIDNYYQNTEFNSEYNFANIETRNISWETDICKEQILVGDSLAISQNQAKEHYLTKVFEIKDPTNLVILVGYETNPVLKCQKNSIE